MLTRSSLITLLAGALAMPGATDEGISPPPEPAPAHSAAEIYNFPLMPTARGARASGKGRLKLAWSPFGVAVDRDGFLVYDLTVVAERLPDPAALGGRVYVAWLASPDLGRIEKFGVLDNTYRISGRIDRWNKFLFMITAERDGDVAERRGPVVLRGRSPSGLIAAFQSHELFNNIPH